MDFVYKHAFIVNAEIFKLLQLEATICDCI